MDTTDNNLQPEPAPDLVLTNDAKYYLNTAARWANFLGILGFIFTGLTVLSALYWLVMGGTIATMATQQQEAASVSPMVGAITGIMTSVGGFVCLIYAAISFFFALYLVRFASSSKRALLYNSVVDITKGIQNLKSFFKLWGIISIIAIALSIIGFIGLIVFAITMASAIHG